MVRVNTRDIVLKTIDEKPLLSIHFCMDTRSAFDWSHARSFLATAEEGSFSAAARALSLTQPTLSRHIASLEARFGMILFEKMGHKLVLTPAGQALLPHMKQMEIAAQAVERVAFGQAQDMHGPVVITAEDLFAARLLPSLIKRIQARAPTLKLSILPDNAKSDLQRRDADIAIRYSRPTEPELIAKRLPDGLGRFYASEAFVKQYGTINKETDLTDIPFISIAPHWDRFLQDLGLKVSRDNLTLMTPHHIVMWEMVQAGLGIGPCDQRIAAQTRGVVPVLQDLAPIPFSTWLVVHGDVRSNPAVRLVFDLLAEEIPRL